MVKRHRSCWVSQSLGLSQMDPHRSRAPPYPWLPPGLGIHSILFVGIPTPRCMMVKVWML